MISGKRKRRSRGGEEKGFVCFVNHWNHGWFFWKRIEKNDLENERWDSEGFWRILKIQGSWRFWSFWSFWRFSDCEILS